MSFYRNTLAIIAVGVSLLMAAPATAQESPFSLEARTGVTFPMGNLSDAGAESDLLFGLDAYLSVNPMFSLYGGYAYHRFTCDACADDVTASGPRLGLKALLYTPGDALPWVRAGATFNQATGLAEGSSDRTLGVELGAGIDYQVAQRLSIVPALRYETFSTNFAGAEESLSYLTLDLGLHLHF